MEIKLTENEIRVLGADRKDITTPILSAVAERAGECCNQKTNRDPVMQLDEDAVRDALEACSSSAWPPAREPIAA